MASLCYLCRATATTAAAVRQEQTTFRLKFRVTTAVQALPIWYSSDDAAAAAELRTVLCVERSAYVTRRFWMLLYESAVFALLDALHTASAAAVS